MATSRAATSPSTLALLLLAGLLLAGLASCDSKGADDDDSGDDDDSLFDDDDTSECEGITPEVTNINPSELNEMLQDKDFQLINVHIPYAGEIPGTDVHIPYTDISDIEEHLGNNPGAKAVLYCLTGPMSAIAADDLVELGYCRIYDLPAAMVGWQAEGYPIEQ